jgi:hypothetical protein
MISPHVLTPGQSLLRKDTTKESKYAALAWRRVLPPVAFVPRLVDLKRDQEFWDAGLVLACHSPTPIQFRSRPREPHIACPPMNVSPFPDVVVSPDGVEALGIHVQTPHKAMEGGRPRKPARIDGSTRIFSNLMPR